MKVSQLLNSAQPRDLLDFRTISNWSHTFL